MNKPKLGKGLAALTGRDLLSTPAAAADDETSSSVRLEQLRYERAILDFEASVRRERDRMTAEHHENMRVALNGEAAE